MLYCQDLKRTYAPSRAARTFSATLSKLQSMRAPKVWYPNYRHVLRQRMGSLHICRRFCRLIMGMYMVDRLTWSRRTKREDFTAMQSVVESDAVNNADIWTSYQIVGSDIYICIKFSRRRIPANHSRFVVVILCRPESPSPPQAVVRVCMMRKSAPNLHKCMSWGSSSSGTLISAGLNHESVQRKSTPQFQWLGCGIFVRWWRTLNVWDQIITGFIRADSDSLLAPTIIYLLHLWGCIYGHRFHTALGISCAYHDAKCESAMRTLKRLYWSLVMQLDLSCTSDESQLWQDSHKTWQAEHIATSSRDLSW